MPADYEIHIDWNGDGDFADPLEDVTDRALARTNVTVQYGRDQYRALAPVSPARGTLELRDDDGRYHPDNAASPLAGLVGPGRELRIQATLSGTTYGLLRGHLDDYQPLPEIEHRSVQFTTLDALAKWQAVKLSTPLHFSVRTGEAVNLVLDALGWPMNKRDIDPGATVVRWWWEEGTDALEALRKIVRSEGPPALITVDADGNAVFRDRHHRLLRAASTTVQATWRSHGAEPTLGKDFTYDAGWRDVINDVTFAVPERQPAGVREVVWQSDGVIAIADGETIPVVAQASEPFTGAVTPVAGTDYVLRSGAVTVTLSRDSGQSATIHVKATGGPAVLSALQLRAHPVPVTHTVQVHGEDPVSVDKHGRRAYPDDAPWAGVHDALAVAQVILGHRAERLPVIRARMVGGNDTRLAQMLGRDLSDRVRVDWAGGHINADFYVERIEHTLSKGAPVHHETVFGCEKAPSQVTNVFRFDTTGAGFDQGRFGRTGLDDPANMFRFDTAGQGFDQGVLAH